MATPVVIRSLVRALLLAALIAAVHAAGARAEEGSDRLRVALELRDQNRLVEAIRILEQLRRSEPSNMDVARLEAETRSWAGQLTRARSQYADLARRGDVASELGLAEIDAWEGNLPAAVRRYQALTGRTETRASALRGLARVRLWQGRTSVAARLANEAQSIAPSRAGTDLQAEIRQARAVRAIGLGFYRSDTDDHTWRLAGIGANGMIGQSDIRAEAVLLAGSAENRTDHVALRKADGMIEYPAGDIWMLGLRAGIESRKPRGASTTNRLLGSASVTADGGIWRAMAGAAVEPLDETPELVRSDIRLTSGSLEAAWSPRPWSGTEAGVSIGRFSDDNTRTSFRTVLRLRAPETRTHPGIAWIHRSFWMDDAGPRAYFSPDRYRLDEAELGFQDAHWHRKLRWSFQAALGAQKVADASVETVRRVSASVDLEPTTRSSISIGATRSEAAWDSPSNYRWDRVVLRMSLAF